MNLDDVFGNPSENYDDENKGGSGYVPTTPIRSKDDVSMDIKREASEFDIMLDTLKGRHAERFNNILDNMNERDFVSAYISVIGYIKPKFRPVEKEKPKTVKRSLNITHHTVKK